ncbi:unnamed protein product [Heterobilharzia americana]|nr:unnamed protein product [Heterobilharzia americana]CAH8625571.1 unnamed protein product [Heterobilharzia americana]
MYSKSRGNSVDEIMMKKRSCNKINRKSILHSPIQPPNNSTHLNAKNISPRLSNSIQSNPQLHVHLLFFLQTHTFIDKHFLSHSTTPHCMPEQTTMYRHKFIHQSYNM